MDGLSPQDLSERRLRTLRELVTQIRPTSRAVEVCIAASRVLNNNHADLPCAWLYLLSADGSIARLAGEVNLPPDGAAPQSLDLSQITVDQPLWPLVDRLQHRDPAATNAAGCELSLQGSPWPAYVETALALPFDLATQSGASGFLIAGLNPQLTLDEHYRGFLEVVAGHIALAIANTRIHETEHQRDAALVELAQTKQALLHEHSLRTQVEVANARIESILANLDDHFVIFDRNWRYTYLNAAAARMLGLPREQLLGQCIWELFPDAVGNLFYREVHRAMAEQQPRFFEHHYTPWDRWIENRVYPSPAGVAVFSTDITERKQGEVEKERLTAQIAMEQQRLAVILDNLPAGVLIADAVGQLIFSNPEVARIFAHPFRSTATMLDYSDWQLFDPLTGAPFPLERMPMVRTLTTGETVVGEEMKLLRGDGAWAYATVNSAPVRDADGQIVMGVAAFIDITARRQAEDQLRRLNATLEQRVRERTAELERINGELNQFAYVASHDLKAPLRAIDHLASWITEDVANLLPPRSAEHLAKMRGRVRRMDKLLDDLLTYSRAGRIQHPFEKVEMGLLLQDLLDVLAPPPGFVITLEPPVFTIHAPRISLELVLRNLIDNAVKHHHRTDGHIVITIADLGDRVEFTVRDDGPGIEPQYHERIFTIFQTLRPRDLVDGSGMGLAIVKKLVESYGGVIRIESTVGNGSTFRFSWPNSPDWAAAKP